MSFKIYSTAKVLGKLKHGKDGDIGDFCFISSELTLEDKVHIAPRVTIVGKGKVYMEEGVTIAPGVVMYTSMPELSTRNATNKYIKHHKSITGDIYIGKNSFIGANSVIGCGTRIKENTRIKPLSNINPILK